MRRISYFVAFLGYILAKACFAAEPTLCTLTCGAERRTCKARAIELAENDREPVYPIERYRHSLASNSAKLQSPSPAEAAMQRSGTQKSRLRHAAACDDSQARCTRTCANTADAGVDSPVIVRNRQVN